MAEQLLQRLTAFSKICPFLGKTTLSQLKQLASNSSHFPTPVSCTSTNSTFCANCPSASSSFSSTDRPSEPCGQNVSEVELIALARQCPMMSKALQSLHQPLDAGNTKVNEFILAKDNPVNSTPTPLNQETLKADVGGGGKSTSATASPCTSAAFDYESFFSHQLDKKHQDKSYRYFNTINRLAHHYPAANTGSGKQVTVWCSNDYLGMSRHPVVLDSMQ